MEPHQETGRTSPEPLEQELYARNAAIEQHLGAGEPDEAERLAWELVHESQPPEFRSDGFHVLGKLALRRGLAEDAADMLEEARRLAIETESYAHAADVQRTIGIALQQLDAPRPLREEAFKTRNFYEESAAKFAPRRFEVRAGFED